MRTSDSPDLSPVVRRFIEEAGGMTQSIGMGRVLGQIYAFLYFSPGARSLHDMQMALGISKGSASMGVRQLEQWDAVRKVWVKGDRKDYYEARDWFGRILRKAMLDTAAKRLQSYAALLDEMEAGLAVSEQKTGNGKFIRDRIQHLRAFQQSAERLWSNPLVQRLIR